MASEDADRRHQWRRAPSEKVTTRPSLRSTSGTNRAKKPTYAASALVDAGCQQRRHPGQTDVIMLKTKEHIRYARRRGTDQARSDHIRALGHPRHQRREDY